MPIGMLASTIQLALGEEVVDRTGLSGNFDYFVTLPRSQNLGAQDPADVWMDRHNVTKGDWQG